uniref:Secreted protein n=1 Tax=Ixodes ricinus TaxID=34613 RepID=A0A6B0UQ56_IXORI
MKSGNLLRSSRLVWLWGVWLVDRRQGSLSTSRRKGESTSRYLDTTYRQNRCRSMPLPHMASWYPLWCRAQATASFCRRSCTVALGSCMANTHALDSHVTGRTVSVRPSRNSRVIEASYVRLNRPASL